MSKIKKLEENQDTEEVLDTTVVDQVEDNEEQTTEETQDEGVTLSVKAVYDKTEKVAVASTDVVDRHNESISQDGWDLKNFKNNPVMLWAHDHKEIAVGICKNVHIERKNGTPRLVFTPVFHDKTETARSLGALFDEGWLNSFSVGFIPKDFDGNANKYLKQELLEISAVNVPANPDARMMAYKSLESKGFTEKTIKAVTGLDEAPEEVEENEDKSVETQKLSDKFKGILADEIAEDKEQQAKWERMRPVNDVFWAFCDVYHDSETKLEDFDALVKELLVEIAKAAGVTPDSDTTTPPAPMDPEEEDAADVVVDKDSDVVDDENKIDEKKVETPVKVQANKETSTAPQAPTIQEARATRSLTKVIATAADKLLENEKSQTKSMESAQMMKIIKRAADILNKKAS